MLTKLATVQCVGVNEEVWCEVLMCSLRMCMKPIGSRTILVQEQGGNNSTQDEYKHRVEGRE